MYYLYQSFKPKEEVTELEPKQTKVGLIKPRTKAEIEKEKEKEFKKKLEELKERGEA